jgi:CheY-like chemotaxis protein
MFESWPEKNNKNNESNERSQRERLMINLGNPYWLPSVKELRPVVDSFTDEDGFLKLSEQERKVWLSFLRNNEHPVFEILTKEYIEGFGKYIIEQAKKININGSHKTVVLEVGAGNGKLSYFLKQEFNKNHNSMIELKTTDLPSKSFNISSPYHNVEKLSYQEALKKYQPDIVLCSWMMPGEDWSEDFRNTPSIKEYILIGPEAPCGTDDTWHNVPFDFFEEEIEDLSELQISRLDILDAPRKETGYVDLVSRTISFKKNID